MGVVDTIVDFVDATRKIMSEARTTPDIVMRRLPADALRVTALSSFVTGLLLVADRWLFQSYELSDPKSAAAAFLVVGTIVTLSFVFIVLASIIFPLAKANREDAEKSANSWAVAFCFVFFLSAVVCLVDLLVRTFAGFEKGPIYAIMSLLGTGRNLFGFRGDHLFPCLAYATIAYLVLLARTLWIDKLYFSLARSLFSFVVLVSFSAITMHIAIWAPLNDFFLNMLSAK